MTSLALVNLWPYVASVVLYWTVARNLTEAVIYALLYPFSLLLLLKSSHDDLEDFFNVPLPEDYEARIAEDAPNVLPIKALLVVGGLEEKKRVARRIVVFVTHGIDIEENMSFLNALLADPHMDVALYASQAKEDIEKYFESKLAVLKGKEYSLEYAMNLYYYIRTGIPKGRMREALMDKLRSVLEHCPKHARYFEMMFFVTGDEDYLKEAYKISRDESYLRRWQFEKLRKRRFDDLRRLTAI